MMNQPISSEMHGLITADSYFAFVSTAPETVGFKDEKNATARCRVMSGGILLSSLLTKAG